MNEVNGLKALCSQLNIFDEFLSVKQIKFLTGGWFEEYIFSYIDEIIPTAKAMNCEIKKTDTNVQNEFDIMFILKNQLHIIEAKTNFQGKSTLHNDTLYKSKALETDFGLRAHSIVATLDRDFEKKKSFLTRAKQMKIKLIFASELAPEKIKDSFKNILGIPNWE